MVLNSRALGIGGLLLMAVGGCVWLTDRLLAPWNVSREGGQGWWIAILLLVLASAVPLLALWFRNALSVTPHEQAAQHRLPQMRDLYSALSRTNHAIIHLHDPDTLFREVCHILTYHGGFIMAWIGQVDAASQRVNPVATSGPVAEMLNTISISVDQATLEGMGPTGKAYRKGGSHIVNDYLADPDLSHWRSMARQFGIRSAGAFNLKVEGKTEAVLAVYAGEPNFFDQEMIDLVQQMTRNLAFALENYRQEERRLKAEEKLKLWARVFESSGEAIYITDDAFRIMIVNRAYTDITGYSATEAVGKIPQALDRQGEEVRGQLRDIGHWQGEVYQWRKKGDPRPVWLSLSAVREGRGRCEPSHYVGIFADISERKEAEARIQFLSNHDVLTGLPNRVLLMDRLEQACAAARKQSVSVALVCLDLDRFKNINDSLGHGVGDALLREVAQRLRAWARAGDTVSRLGSDEFAVVVTGVREVGDAAHAAEAIQKGLSQPYAIDGFEFSITPSIGISLWPQDDANPQALVRNADAAVFHAKTSARGGYRFFTPEMNAAALERLTLENNLRRAVERGSFALHYQPQVDITSGAIIGAEALLRWQDPELGTISPARFIPLAEDTGLIIPLGEWVLNEACTQNRRWQDQGLPAITLAVNLSALHLQRQDLQDTVVRVLRECGLDPHYLELELTEGAIMKDAGRAVVTLQGLKNMGLHCAIDDFGTGYSSLSYLKRFPLDKLKIDRSFVRDVDSNSSDAEIVRAIIALARSLRLKVIAEGVETAPQLAFLRRQCCDEMQGFFFSRPLPAEEFGELLRAGRRLELH